MLFKNGIDTATIEEVSKEIKKHADELRKIEGEYVVLKSTKDLKRNPRGGLERPQTVAINYVCTASDKTGRHTWNYCESYPEIVNGRINMNNLMEKAKLFRGLWRIKIEGNEDWLYYLLKVYSNTNLGSFYKLEDKEKEAALRAQGLTLEADIIQLLYSTNSPLNNEDKLKDVARYLGVENVANTKYYTLKEEVAKKIRFFHEHPELGVTLKDIQHKSNSTSEELTLRSQISAAIDAGIIYIDPTDRYAYFTDMNTGERVDRLVQSPLTVKLNDPTSRVEWLFNFFTINKGKAEVLAEMTSGKLKAPPVGEFEVSDLNNMPRPQLMKLAKDNGIKGSNTKSNEELIKVLKEIAEAKK